MKKSLTAYIYLQITTNGVVFNELPLRATDWRVEFTVEATEAEPGPAALITAKVWLISLPESGL